MNDSIELYDELHSMSREPLSIEEANAKGCNFYDNEPTRNAFQDFRECFQSFCDEQNCVEGEPFAQEAPSIRPFLDSHKATKRPSRRLKIGVKAPPVMSIARKPVAAVRQPIEKKIREVKISPKATVLRSVKDPRAGHRKGRNLPNVCAGKQQRSVSRRRLLLAQRLRGRLPEKQGRVRQTPRVSRQA